MTEFDGATIPMKVVRSRRIDAAEAPTVPARRARKKPAISTIAFLVVALAAVGWGTWHFTHSSSDVDDGESIAEIEGFESAPPFVANPPKEDSRASKFGIAASTNKLTMPELPADLFSVDEPATTAEVWLIGTIEEAEATERNELPTRLSGGPGESSTLR